MLSICRFSKYYSYLTFIEINSKYNQFSSSLRYYFTLNFYPCHTRNMLFNRKHLKNYMGVINFNSINFFRLLSLIKQFKCFNYMHSLGISLLILSFFSPIGLPLQLCYSASDNHTSSAILHLAIMHRNELWYYIIILLLLVIGISIFNMRSL